MRTLTPLPPSYYHTSESMILSKEYRVASYNTRVYLRARAHAMAMLVNCSMWS